MKPEKTIIEQQWFTRIVVVMLIGIALRVFVSFVVLGDMPQYEDGPSYSLQAQQFIRGDVDYLYFPPGTSLSAIPLYWMFGQSLVVDHVIGVLLTSGFMIIAVWFSSVIFGWSRAAFFAALLMAFYPHSVLSATQISSLPLNALLLTGAAGLVIRCTTHWSWWRWIGASLCLAGATLTRPTSVMLLAVLAIGAIYLLWHRRIAFGRVALATTVMCVVIAAAVYPFMEHNSRHGQGWTLSTNNEWNLFLSNTPYTPDYKTGHFGQRRFDQVSPEARAYMSAILPHESPYAATLAQRTAMKEAAFKYMLQHPMRTSYRIANRFRSYVSLDYTASRAIQNAYGLSNASFAPLLALEGGGYLLLLLLAVSAPFLSGMSMAGKGTMLLSICLAGMLPYLLAFAQARHHLPAIPMLLIATVIALGEIEKGPRLAVWSKLRTQWLWWVVIAIIVAIQIENLYYLILFR